MIDKNKLEKYISYNPETGKLYWKVNKNSRARKGKEAGCVWHCNENLKYIFVRIDYQLYRAHRLAFLLMEGRWPEQVDHINGDGLDNRWENLREVNHRENHRNEKLSKNNTSGVTGVSFSKKLNKWLAYIKINYKTVHLGCYLEYDDAVSSRKRAEEKYGFHKNHGRKGVSLD